MPARPTTRILKAMSTISSVGGTPAAGAQTPVDLKMLKKGQDLAKDQAAQLLAALPPPQSPNPNGVGGKIDMLA